MSIDKMMGTSASKASEPANVAQQDDTNVAQQDNTNENSSSEISTPPEDTEKQDNPAYETHNNNLTNELAPTSNHNLASGYDPPSINLDNESAPTSNNLTNGDAPSDDTRRCNGHHAMAANAHALSPAAGLNLPLPAANVEAKYSNEVPLVDEAMADTEQIRPAKKQKQDSSSMDASPDISDDGGTTSSANKEINGSVQVSSDSGDGTGTNDVIANNESAPTSTSTTDDIHPSIAEIIKLEDIPDVVEPLKSLTLLDMAELESALQIGDTYGYANDDGWKSDWGGNLLLCIKEVVINKGYIADQPNAKPIRLRYCDWVSSNASNGDGLRGLELLFRFVYHMKGTPDMAKKILAYAIHRPAESVQHRLQFITDAIRRATYDPAVLQQDGWIIKKAPEGGEAFHIGRRIMWQKHEAIVLAFTEDEEYGGLWKGIFVEDLETFDLEPGELQTAIKRWDNKQKQSSKKRTSARASPPSGSTRFSATQNFHVDGIEHGIILAVPTSRNAQGVLWPARVRHVIEENRITSGNARRNSSKNQINVVFLAPFWNGQYSSKISSDSKDAYSLGPLFEFDNIEVSEYNIQKYPFDAISLEKVRSSFRFLGVPNGVFPRYLDAHRLAVALRLYSVQHMSKDYASRSDDQVQASASLTESHALSVRTPLFPEVALTMPFEYMLSKLPHPSEISVSSMGTDDDDESNDIEPTIDIGAICRSFEPPECFGKKRSLAEHDDSLMTPRDDTKTILSPDPNFTPKVAATKEVPPQKQEGDERKQEDEDALWSINKFASDYLLSLFLNASSSDDLAIDGPRHMENMIKSLIVKLRKLCDEFGGYSVSKRKAETRNILCQVLQFKGHGEDSLGIIPSGASKATVITEWRKACERIYKRAVAKLSSEGVGNNVTSVLTDSRCNGHITQSGSFERPVRIPAAIKGAKYAGAGVDPNVLLITAIEDSYLEVAEDVVSKCHKGSYIKRLKARVASIPPNQIGVPLTEDSEGEGGEDTMGSRGSYTAAIVGVAAAIKATEMVVGGQCVNAFCAVRPPGHHAGQELRSMRAISNGFCLFNGAACAATYATTPISQGGLGLRRVCVVDFDVHHGNGTQDCLCATYDPRYLYVSLHAGGAHINGYDDEDSDEEQFRLRLGGKKEDGIFPGRCGDTSPHAGVLNLPLGQRVDAASMGAALVSEVLPRVESFSPDLIILSAGFDAHVNDPLGMGGLTAEDFRSVTEVACQMAYKTCSGRILSLLEGGYGVPCCQPRDDLFLPKTTDERVLYLGTDVMPADMKDEVPFTLRQKLDRCHAEGFIECVQNHVKGLVKCNGRK